jgi:hypothetical protein
VDHLLDLGRYPDEVCQGSLDVLAMTSVAQPEDILDQEERMPRRVVGGRALFGAGGI